MDADDHAEASWPLAESNEDRDVGALLALGIMPAGVMATPTYNNGAVPNFAAAPNDGQQFKDVLAREAGTVTPGVDDTPYLLYALDALTGDVTPTTTAADASTTAGAAPHTHTHTHNSFPYRYIPDEHLGYYRPRSVPRPATTSIGTATIKMAPNASPPALSQHRFSLERAASRGHLSQGRRPPTASPRLSQEPRSSTNTASSFSTLVHSDGPQQQQQYQQHQHQHQQQTPRRSHPSSQLPPNHLKDSWIYLDLKTYAPQAGLVFASPTYKPAILRTVPAAVLAALCLLMTAALLFCAVYSHKHDGLVGFHGGLYGGPYFVFRVLPQLVSAALLLYAQAMAVAAFRIFPFSRMEGFENAYPEERAGALFDDLYPRSFLLPQISRSMPWRLSAPLVVLWLMNMTVPLQSALFTVVPVVTGHGADADAGQQQQHWRWAATQGVAWTLVALYLVFAGAVGALWWFWYRRATGLIWDPRSIADAIVLASNSNTMADYDGTELMATRGDLRQALRHRAVDKLGYWTWRDGRSSGLWHGIGTDMLDEAWVDGMEGRPQDRVEDRVEDGEDRAEKGLPELSPHTESVRYRYLPWCLRGPVLVGATVTAFVLLLVLFVVSFTPTTGIQGGFRPRVPTAATASGGAFSAADFLYSFLPALLGQLLYLLFLGWDQALRVLQPWAELAKHAGGAAPEASILADYAACLPLQSTWHALRNGHWRVAAVSLLGTVFAFLGALAGGLFLAMTVVQDGSVRTVRMLPNMGLYGFVLALLVAYVVGLMALLPDRRVFRLPHAVWCLAEVLSFCANEDLLREPAFKNVHERGALLDQLGMRSPAADRSRWIFASGTSGDDRRLGIRRMRRYTELTNRPSARRAAAAAAAGAAGAGAQAGPMRPAAAVVRYVPAQPV